MNKISREQYDRKIQEGYNTVPIYIKVDKRIDAALVYETFCSDPTQGGILESGQSGRFSYIAFKPIATIKTKNGKVEVHQSHNSTMIEDVDPLHELENLMNKWKAPLWQEGPDWQGGALGFFSYDFVQYIEKIDTKSTDDLDIPDLLFTVYRDLIAIDHENEAVFLITNVLYDEGDHYDAGTARVEEMQQRIIDMSMDSAPVTATLLKNKQFDITSSFTKEEFEQVILKTQEYIRNGEVFQVNLSVRQDFPLSVSPWSVYCELRKINPSPYMGYLHYPEYQFVSGSPELLIKVKGRKIATRPIGGTRSRGKDAAEDLKLTKELISDEKERAEHIMLVDLERNDLGKVCTYGSVQVTDLMVIEKYSHVIHMVSHIEGELATNKSIYDAIRATFPGGTITGAPKIRTIEIIEELEPVKRGLYTGSIGWIGFNGDLALNIVIRTLVAKSGMGHVQAGAGLVIDSNPEAEYYESLKKAEAIFNSVEMSENSEAN